MLIQNTLGSCVDTFGPQDLLRPPSLRGILGFGFWDFGAVVLATTGA